MPKKNNVVFSKPAEPSFITKMKQQTGYKEGPTVDTKHENLPDYDSDDDNLLCEEGPTVVVLKPGDLTKEEADKIIKEKGESEPTPLDGKITFKKPVKRTSEDNEKNSNLFSSKKLKNADKNKKDSNKGDRGQMKNASLLSFNEDDE